MGNKVRARSYYQSGGALFRHQYSPTEEDANFEALMLLGTHLENAHLRREFQKERFPLSASN